MSFWAAFLLSSLLAADPDRPALTGIVVDAEGNPIAGARVDIASAAPRIGRAIFCPTCYLDCRKWTKTGDDGRFLIERLDPTLKFRLLVSLPGKRAQLTQLIVPGMDQPTIELQARPADGPANHTVRGRVLDDQGIPISGALVEAYGARTSEKRWWGRVDVETVVTDSEGQFAILTPHDYQGLDLKIMADGFAGATTDLLATGTVHELTIPTGTSVTGRLVHLGRAARDLSIAVVQIERNTGHHFVMAVPDITDAEERFRFDHLPAGEAHVIYSQIDGSNTPVVLATKRFLANDNGKIRDLGDLEVIPSLRLAGRLDLPVGLSLPFHPGYETAIWPMSAPAPASRDLA